MHAKSIVCIIFAFRGPDFSICKCSNMVIMIMLEVYMCKNVVLCVSVSTIKLLKKV